MQNNALSDAGFEAVISSKRYLRRGVILLTVLFASVVAWSVFTKVKAAVISQGQIEVETGRHVVQHKYGGNVAEIFVRENDYVEKGEVLMRLEGNELELQLQARELQYYEMLAQVDRLNAEITQSSELVFQQELLENQRVQPKIERILASQTQLFEARMQGYQTQKKLLEERVAQLENSVTDLAAQIEVLEAQLAINQEEFERQEKLWQQKLTTSDVYTSVQGALTQIQTNLLSARLNLSNSESEKSQTEKQLQGFATNFIEELHRELRQSETELNQIAISRAEIRDQTSRLDIISPKAGYIYGLRVNSTEQVLSPAEAIMYVIPDDVEFIIKSRVFPADIEDVFAGQHAEISFSGLASDLLPKIEGEVVRVTADSVLDQNSGGQFFEVETAIKAGELEKLQGAELRPGMPAEVFFITKERSPLQYIISPVTNYLDRALR